MNKRKLKNMVGHSLINNYFKGPQTMVVDRINNLDFICLEEATPSVEFTSKSINSFITLNGFTSNDYFSKGDDGKSFVDDIIHKSHVVPSSFSINDSGIYECRFNLTPFSDQKIYQFIDLKIGKGSFKEKETNKGLKNHPNSSYFTNEMGQKLIDEHFIDEQFRLTQRLSKNKLFYERNFVHAVFKYDSKIAKHVPTIVLRTNVNKELFGKIAIKYRCPQPPIGEIILKELQAGVPVTPMKIDSPSTDCHIFKYELRPEISTPGGDFYSPKRVELVAIGRELILEF